MQSVKEILTNLERENRLRLIPASPRDGMIDLSSNDYLSLGVHGSQFLEEFLLRFPDAAFSSSASRLLSSHQKYHCLLEDYLSSLYSRSSLLFNSGYHANVGCIGALSMPSTLFLCDKLIHASVIDGLHIAGANFKRFPHNDIEKLELILQKESGLHRNIIVVVESIYSMDGDEAPLHRIVELKSQYPELSIYVDEAHAFGVRGERGLGICEELGFLDQIDIIIGTFGKAAASCGAFAICSEEIKSLFVNCARPFIFSTALPPVNIAWSLFMTEKIIEMKEERHRLKILSENFRRRLDEVASTHSPSTSQIIPFITGDATKALELAWRLKEAGIIALPIRRPTVPPGGERIRFSLGADTPSHCFDKVVNIIKQF